MLWLTGAHWVSGRLCRSQNTWKASRPLPYASCVESTHEWPSTVAMRCRSASSSGELLVEWLMLVLVVVAGWAGNHLLIWLCARQWGQSMDCFRVRLVEYGVTCHLDSLEGVALGMCWGHAQLQLRVWEVAGWLLLWPGSVPFLC